MDALILDTDTHALRLADRVRATDGELLHEIFERQVRRNPDATALMCEGQSLTYAALNDRANRLARHLQATGLRPDQLVALCVERSLDLVVGLLGILKAGGAYVPLDPHYPAERLRYMLADSAPAVVLIQSSLIQKLPETRATVVAFDDDRPEIAAQSTENLDIRATGVQPHHLAYVIYTSGSTGEPKGVMVEHRQVSRLFRATEHWFELNDGDVWTLFHSFAFDFSVWEIWGALLYGGRLVVVPYLTARAPLDFYELLCREGVTMLNQTPSAFAQLSDAQAQRRDAQHSLRTVIFGGEALDLRRLQPWVERNGTDQPQLINMYGITETTVHVTYRRLMPSDIAAAERSLIGVPIPDLQIYLLDPQGAPVPVGEVGEIYVGGAGIARGYLNRPALTDERFVQNPFHPRSHGRLYKSGDLARRLADGSLEYLGRGDRQVKIRGFRIELGEIEAHLARHPHIKEAVVTMREDAPGDKRLVAYVIVKPETFNPQHGNDSRQPLIPQWRDHLSASLPAHMVPSAFVILDVLPLTHNGKLDRQALPAPGLEAYVAHEYEPPQNPTEEMLARLWQELLRVERVGRLDHFFELGGHSQLVLQLMERLGRTGLSATAPTFYANPVLADLARALTTPTKERFEIPPNQIPPGCESIAPQMLTLVNLTAEQIDTIVATVPGGAANIQDIYPLAPLQQGILFHHLLDGRSGDTYVLVTLLSLSSREKRDVFIRGLQRVIDRHDALRTAILWEQLPEPVQVVYRRATLSVDEFVLDPGSDPMEQLEERMRPEHQRLDLKQAPLVRLEVNTAAEGLQQYAILKLHHLVCDNESLDTLLAEVLAYLQSDQQPLPPPIAYRNHVARALARAKAQDSEQFFRTRLADVQEPTAPFGLLDVHSDGSAIVQARARLDSALADRVRAQSRLLGVSAATVFHAVWALVVAATSSREDVVYGTVLFGRLQESALAAQSVGLFINTLPLRIQLAGATARELLEQTHRELTQLLDHEQASLAAAQRCSGLAGSAPLFTSLLNYRHSEIDLTSETARTVGVRQLARYNWSNYPIVLSVDDDGTTFTLEAETTSSIDPHRIISYVCTALQSFVDSLERYPQTEATKLPVLPEDERRQVIETFNSTSAPYPREKLIHQLFEEQARLRPQEIAAISATQRITYEQLNDRSSRLARMLVEYGVRPDDRVAVFIDRSIDMLVALLGILKAGGGYVPLDVTNPAERLAYILTDAAPSAVLTTQALRRRLPTTTTAVFTLDTYDALDAKGVDTRPLSLEPLAPELKSEHLAYVIYTSGSTGAPKGVMVAHRNVTNLIAWHRAAFDLQAGRLSSWVAATGFDASVWEIWPSLTTGGTLVLAPPETAGDTDALLRWWASQPLDVSFLPTPVAELAFSRNIHNDHLRTLLIGGDRLRQNLARGRTTLINNYGPTESTVVATSGAISSDESVLHIGRPIANTRIYILDRHGNPAPLGVPGEIYIGGASVARGYLNRPDLTAQRFVTDPFTSDPRAKMYRSGDLARWRADGTIEFLGRNDDQVKIRGYRIELGEIEARLSNHPAVRDAVVIVREDVPGEPYLAAYVCPLDGAEFGVDSLHEHLKVTLPAYMIPRAFVRLDALPLTPNGKLDRRALPVPLRTTEGRLEYQPPQGELEQMLAGVWQEILHVEQVGRADNFFDLGGHSLLATQTLARIRAWLGIEISMQTLFDFPVLEDLAAELDQLVEAHLMNSAAEGSHLQELLNSMPNLSDERVQQLVSELERGELP